MPLALSVSHQSTGILSEGQVVLAVLQGAGKGGWGEHSHPSGGIAICPAESGALRPLRNVSEGRGQMDEKVLPSF